MIDRSDFVARFGGVFEHSPWVAEGAYDAGLPADWANAERLHGLLCTAMLAAPEDRKLALIRAHPDLAGRLAETGALTAASKSEQASAGLDRLSEEERQRFRRLNAAYKERFGFPYVLAVKGRDKTEILDNLEARIGNTPEAEFDEALAQIETIALLRLKDLLP